MENLLVQEAIEARKSAYVPYSKFPVGAAVLAASGNIYRGCNIENASYGLCNCAERTAIFKAVSAGDVQLMTMAVIADTERPVAPCGACRQVMAEFNIETVILANVKGERMVLRLEELLPYSFGRCDLEKG